MNIFSDLMSVLLGFYFIVGLNCAVISNRKLDISGKYDRDLLIQNPMINVCFSFPCGTRET